MGLRCPGVALQPDLTGTPYLTVQWRSKAAKGLVHIFIALVTSSWCLEVF